MSRYLRFESRTLPEAVQPYAAVFTGRLPTRFLSLKGVLINNQLADFEDPELPDKLLRTLKDGEKLAKTQYFDCSTFALLMAGHELLKLTPQEKLQLRVDDYDYDSQPADWKSGTIVDIGAKTGQEEAVFDHIVSVAPQLSGMSVIHKVGNNGRVFLSDLAFAQTLYASNVALAVESFSLLDGDDQLLSWRAGLPNSPLELGSER